ncbi:MAG: hypothetical protein AB1646_20810 [Thermodesulfobacteriota bacterium]
MSILQSQYKTTALACHRTEDGVDIWFAGQDSQIAELCISAMNEARDHVEAFFDYRQNHHDRTRPQPSKKASARHHKNSVNGQNQTISQRFSEGGPGDNPFSTGFPPEDFLIKLFIFMYPDLSAMSEAFGRELPDEHCCFVPTKGLESLIAFVTPRSNLHSLRVILAHEYCHIVVGCLTGNRETGQTSQSIPTWLDEGVALFVDRKFREDLPEIERKRLELIRQGADGWWPDLEDMYTYFNRLDGDVEFGRRGMLAYAYSYFCVKELIRRFDEQTFVQFTISLASCNDIPSLFLQTFGLSVGQFNSEMKSSLRRNKHRCDFTQRDRHDGE